MGASSFSPSPITTMPSMGTLSRTMRMASTAAPSAPFLSPRPIQRDAARAAASVTRTSSMARLRSGRCFSFMRRIYLAWLNGSVGQLSDPYEQGEDDGLGITISGLPGELDDPDPDPDDVDAADAGGAGRADDDGGIHDGGDDGGTDDDGADGVEVVY